MAEDGTSTQPVKRRRRVTRAEGELRLVEATIELYRTGDLEGASVREIARRADMNHGYVHVWFGSKGGLLVAAIEHLSKRMTVADRTRNLDERLVSDPDLVTLLRMIAVLQAGYPDLRPFGGARPPLMALAELQRHQRGVDEKTALTIAELMIAVASGALLVGRTLQFDYLAMMTTWRQMLNGTFPATN